MPTYVTGRCPLCQAEVCPPIDSTPPHPKPPLDLIEAAMRDVPTVLANRSPIGAQKRIEWYSTAVTGGLKEFGHTIAAGAWAVHQLIEAGRLSVHSSFSALHSATPDWGNQSVRAEPSLWESWEANDADSGSRDSHAILPASLGQDITALLILKQNPELSHAEVAERMGLHRTVMYNKVRFPTYNAYRDVLAQSDADRIPSGYKSSNGTIEAQAK